MIEYFALFLCITAALTEQVCLMGFIRFPYAYGIPIRKITLTFAESILAATDKEPFSIVSYRLSYNNVFVASSIPNFEEVFVREAFCKSNFGLLMLCANVIIEDHITIVIRANTFTGIFALSLSALAAVLGFSVILQIGVLVTFIVLSIISFLRFQNYLYDRLSANRGVNADEAE
ncbi:MAG: hypothetical protein AB9866_04765 [Syntrophobacteraceae bacterium]